MTGILCAIVGGAGGSYLDTQTVTTGVYGTALNQDRIRGYDATVPIGSCSPGTSGIYGGAAITQIAWYENYGFPFYVLTITGATDSGWTSMTVDASLTLLRASASSFSSGSWAWSTSDTVSTQVFGASGSRLVTFS